MALQKTLKVFTLFLPKRFNWLLIICVTLMASGIYAQLVMQEFKKDSLKTFAVLPSQKTIPPNYLEVIQTALTYYPELYNTKIKFRIKKQASPLTARPTIFAIFRKASKRKYIIAISDKTNSKFSGILLKNLSFNSQIGVIGHELGHISFYGKKRGLYFLKLILMHLSKKSMDKFEYSTDMICIEHGLGYQLLSWSKEVRLKLNLIHWKGINQLQENGRERYMNPETITKVISENKIYN